MECITRLKEAFIASIGSVIKRGAVQADSLSELEVEVKQMLHEVGGEVLRQLLEAQDEKYPADEQPYACGEQAGYVRRREGGARKRRQATSGKEA